MTYGQVILLGFFILLAALSASLLHAASIKIAITSGMKDVIRDTISHYIQKKKEAIEQLEQQFGDGSTKPVKQQWDA